MIEAEQTARVTHGGGRGHVGGKNTVLDEGKDVSVIGSRDAS